MPELDLKSLRKVAEAATLVPWHLGRPFEMRGAWRIAGVSPALRATEEDANHIATFDPPTVLALLDMLHYEKSALEAFSEERNLWRTRAETAEAKLAAVRELHQPFAWENVHGEAQTECTHCVGEYDGSVHYPCATIRALDGAE